MFFNKDNNPIIAITLGLNLLLLILGISARWQNQTWYWNMDLIGINFIGLFLGFILGIYIGGKAEQNEIQKRDDMWLKKIDKLEKKIEELQDKS